MNTVMSPRLKMSKSRIPVLRVKIPASSIVNNSKKKVPGKPILIAPLPASKKLTDSNSLKDLSNSKVVKPDKAVEKDKCIRTLKYDRNRQSSITSNGKVSDVNKKNVSSQLKNSAKIEISRKKVINQPSSGKKVILKSKDTVSKGGVINDTGKRKISTLKTNAPTAKNKSEDKTIESSQLKNSAKIEISKKKVINQPSSGKEVVLKSKDTVSSGRVIKDTGKRKIASTLKTNAPTVKNKSEDKIIKPIVEPSGLSDKSASSRCASEKENKASLNPSSLAEQKDIKFEVSENSRKMILREHAPSPAIGNKLSGFRLSSRPSQRPSIYQPMEMAADPYKEAMRAIACFSEKRKQRMQGNAEKPAKPPSPLMDRNSCYTPFADPRKEVMESLKKVKLKEQFDKLTPSRYLSVKENKALKSILAAQKDIKFEVNENSRNMILREQAPSPAIGNKLSGFRLSSRPSQRPSIYQPMEMAADPYKEAMRAIACFSEKKKQERLNSEKASKLMSPFKDRNSFYTPCPDSKKDVMETLRKLTLKQDQQKSTKKVTFNLNVIEHTPNNVSDEEPEVFQEGKLSQIDEKSEENTPSSPEIKKAALPPAHRDKANVHAANFEANDENHPNDKGVTVTDNGKCEKFAKSIPPSIATTMKPKELSNVQCKETTAQNYEEIDSSPVFANLCFKTVSVMDEISTKYERTSNKKIHTPRPISFYSRSKLPDSCSPEFLVSGGPLTFLKEAPIRTPLVLKSMAKNTEELSPDVDNNLSPVRLKLNFTEKETPRIKISEFHPPQHRKQIKTFHSQLDELADQECRICFSDESTTAVVCGRYITNPVAETLAGGDEMHFIPIKL